MLQTLTMLFFSPTGGTLRAAINVGNPVLARRADAVQRLFASKDASVIRCSS